MNYSVVSGRLAVHRLLTFVKLSGIGDSDGEHLYQI